VTVFLIVPSLKVVASSYVTVVVLILCVTVETELRTSMMIVLFIVLLRSHARNLCRESLCRESSPS